MIPMVENKVTRMTTAQGLPEAVRKTLEAVCQQGNAIAKFLNDQAAEKVAEKPVEETQEETQTEPTNEETD